jgi:hypothetical protein
VCARVLVSWCVFAYLWVSARVCGHRVASSDPVSRGIKPRPKEAPNEAGAVVIIIIIIIIIIVVVVVVHI